VRRLELFDIALKESEFSGHVRVVGQRELQPLYHCRAKTTLGEMIDSVPEGSFAHAAEVRGLLGRCGDKNTPFAKLPNHFKNIVHTTALITPFLMVPGLSVLVAPHDSAARQYYEWFLEARLPVPETVSLVSFHDQFARQYPFALTSLNLGLDNLGFQAFHAILRDISLVIGRRLSISAIPWFNHTATLAAAK
jgi:hypothetical protein